MASSCLPLCASAFLREVLKINVFNKYNFTKNEILAKNNYGYDLLSLGCRYSNYKLLKYLIIKHKFTDLFKMSQLLWLFLFSVFETISFAYATT